MKVDRNIHPIFGNRVIYDLPNLTNVPPRLTDIIVYGDGYEVAYMFHLFDGTGGYDLYDVVKRFGFKAMLLNSEECANCYEIIDRTGECSLEEWTPTKPQGDWIYGGKWYQECGDMVACFLSYRDSFYDDIDDTGAGK